MLISLQDTRIGCSLSLIEPLAFANRTGNQSLQMQKIFGALRVDPITGLLIAIKNINLRKTMAYQPLYTAVATATGGRDGHVESSDGVVKLDLSIPHEMGGPGKPGTSNPEQLFAAGYSACFAGAIGFVANQQHKKLSDVQVTGHVTFGKLDDKFQLAVQLDIRLPGVDKAEAEKLVEQAHQVCPYSRATRNNIEVKLVVV
jgi:Ohr subfamily peroxiredoxin